MSEALRPAAARHDPRAADLGDAVLIERSITAPEAFAVLFDRHAPAVCRYIARRLGPDAADGLVWEAFLIAFARRGNYVAAQPDARPWLYGIATNLIGRRRLADSLWRHDRPSGHHSVHAQVRRAVGAIAMGGACGSVRYGFVG